MNVAMPDSEHLIKALFITIPIGIAFGLIAAIIRRALSRSGRLEKMENWRRAIYTIGIFMFGALSYYCFYGINQSTFGQIYLIMAVLNSVCLLRSIRRNRPEIAPPTRRGSGKRQAMKLSQQPMPDDRLAGLN